MARSVLFLPLLFSLSVSLHAATPPETPGKMACVLPATVEYVFEGEIEDRVDANVEQWLISAPYANPGMIGMFHVRDREPVPQIVPWAGEFVGKYLISAIQARRMTDNPTLDGIVGMVVNQFIRTQAEDGYLGPFRKEERLLGHWDLWGHYHALLALLLWHEESGSQNAMEAAKKAADLVCKVYLDTDRTPLDAGSDEMNLSIVHALGKLYRMTGKEDYFRLMRVIEEDWKKAGDYFRGGLAGTPYYELPRARWESLHCLEGLVEFYRITGNEDYKTAFINLWESIRATDRHNTGGFSTNEGAIGTPYQPGPIETCCTTAWSALSRDMLLLSGDSRAADELEWSLWNSVLGSQHPSGRWWTYNTPMDGKREASAHTIVFQARAGTPELNCCSVNAPRGLGILSDWGVVFTPDGGLVLNYFGPYEASLEAPNGNQVHIQCDTDYPQSGEISFTVESKDPLPSVKVRIPEWSKESLVRLESGSFEPVACGKYLEVPAGNKKMRFDLKLDFSIRTWVGNEEAYGKVSIYRGPILLAFDQIRNDYDCPDIPALDYNDLDAKRIPIPAGRISPWMEFEFEGDDGRPVRLIDFASAGFQGTEYRSWLPVVNAPPPAFRLLEPKNRESIAPGLHLFTWTGPDKAEDLSYTLEIADNPDMKNPLHALEGIEGNRVILEKELDGDRNYFWRVSASNPNGTVVNDGGARSFHIDGGLPSIGASERARVVYREDGLVASSQLNGSGEPVYGHVATAQGIVPSPGRKGEPNQAVRFEGEGRLMYEIPHWPLEDYTFLAWVLPEKGPEGHLAQIFSAWCRGGDDPLRVTLDGDRLFARIEGSGNHSTAGVPVRYGEWQHIAATKKGDRLRLYVDGKEAGSTWCPSNLRGTRCKNIALGANPLHTGPEFFVGSIDSFELWARAFSPEEIAASAERE
jgi:DUF1680 family protein